MSLELAQVNHLLKKRAGTDWPATYTPRELAYLQTWTGGVDPKAWNDRAAPWLAWLIQECERDEIASTSTTKTVNRPNPGALVHKRPSGAIVYLSPNATTSKSVSARHVTAQAFASWLKAKGKQPSALIAAWFKAQDVAVEAAQPVSAPAPDTNSPPAVAPTEKAVPYRSKNHQDHLKAILEAKGKDVAWLRAQKAHCERLFGRGYVPKFLDELRTLGIDVPGGDPNRVVNLLLKANKSPAAGPFDQLIRSPKPGSKR